MTDHTPTPPLEAGPGTPTFPAVPTSPGSDPASASTPAADPTRAGWSFDHSYARLPEGFAVRVRPTPVSAPQLKVFNRSLATFLGLDPEGLAGQEAAALFVGNRLPEGADPIAQAYAGHQFGNLTRLGDGRAILLGEQRTPTGARFDVQLKGAGPTPWSRRGDGRAALGPMLREYLVSEAMYALGIPTTRSLAVATTGEPVFREQPLPGAVLTRVAASHLRVGTFEYFAARGDHDALRVLTDYTLRRHDPERAGDERPALALLEGVLERQAFLVAQWLRVGFGHGVMNTDNVALSGETLDYGPCAFLDAYDPRAVFSSIDEQGRYAFGNQPGITAWNLARLAETLLPLLDPDPDRSLELAQAVLGTFGSRFQHHWLGVVRGKLGLFTEEAGDSALLEELLEGMRLTRADFTETFRRLDPGLDGWATFGQGAEPELLEWHFRWLDRLARQPQSAAEVTARMQAHNPAVIPRNHLVEEALLAATEGSDLARFEGLVKALERPYDAVDPRDRLRVELGQAPPPGTPPCRTFCGT
jgi:uncharacterized protein YdiU (UPF0061 family)